MTPSEIEILKDFVSKVDYYLEVGELNKLNSELNNMCIYILRKEGMLDVTGLLSDPTDILVGFKKREKPLIQMGMNDILETKTIPRRKYEFYKKRYANIKG